MIEQQARVVRCDDTSIWLSTIVQSGCSSCQVSGTCGTSIVSQLFPDRPEQLLKLSISNVDERLSPGDQVIVGIDESYLQYASLLLYAVPLFTLFVGAGSGAWLGQSLFSATAGELASIFLGLLGLFAGLNFVRRHSLKREKQLEQHARILRVERTSIAIEIPSLVD